MSVLVSFNMKSNVNTGTEVKVCDWGRLMETRLKQQYPDLTIKLDTQKDQKLTYIMEFNNRPTSVADIRSRLFSFLQYYPAMEIEDLQIQLLA